MTSIHAPVTEIGRLAAERLIQHLNEGRRCQSCRLEHNLARDDHRPGHDGRAAVRYGSRA